MIEKPLWAMSRREAEAILRERAGLPPLRNRHRPIILLVLSFVLLACGGYVLTRDRAPEREVMDAGEAPPAHVSVSERISVREGSVRVTVPLSGSLRPRSSVMVSSEGAGLVNEVRADVGDEVDEGEVLVRLDPEGARIDRDAAISQAEATRSQLRLARSELDRARSLSDRGLSPAAKTEQAEGAVENLAALLAAQEDQVRAAELRLSRTEVRAPFMGIVASREADPGSYVGIGSPLIGLVDVSVMRMDASAPIRDAPLILPGMPASISVAGRDGVTEARVIIVSPVTEEGTRTARVTIEMPNAEGALLGGMFATGEVTLRERDGVITVPEGAIRRDDGGDYALRISGGETVRSPIEVGEPWPGGETEVLRGLSEGDVIISAPLPDLVAGRRVVLDDF